MLKKLQVTFLGEKRKTIVNRRRIFNVWAGPVGRRSRAVHTRSNPPPRSDYLEVWRLFLQREFRRTSCAGFGTHWRGVRINTAVNINLDASCGRWRSFSENTFYNQRGCGRRRVRERENKIVRGAAKQKAVRRTTDGSSPI